MKNLSRPSTRKLTSALAAVIAALCCFSASVSAITVSTLVGSGADAELAGWTGPDTNSTSVADSANGTAALANIRTTTNRNEVLVMRFDLTGHTLTDYIDYGIELFNQRNNSAGATLRFYGITDNAVAEDNNGTVRGYTDDTWQESPLEFSTMPGMHWTNSSTAQQTVNSSAVFLGSVTPTAINEGTIVGFGTAALANFIRNHPDQLVTIIVQRSDSGSGQTRFMTREASTSATSVLNGSAGDFAPRLSFGNPITSVTWAGPGTDWNQATNWFIQMVPTNGISAVVPAGFTVNYSSPMVASSFSGLTNSSVININTNKFIIDANLGVPLVVLPSGLLVINSNGVVTITNSGSATMSTPTSGTSPAISVLGGTLIVTNSSTFNMGEGTSSDANIGAAFTNLGGNVTFGSQLAVRSRDSRLFMSNGTFNALGGLNLNVSGNDLRQFFRFTAGTANLGDINVNRATTAGGVSVEGGVVNSSSIRVGTGVASGNSKMTGGIWTNTGLFYIGDRNNPATGSRRTFFTMSGGSLTTLGSDGIVINNQGQTTLAAPTDDGGTLAVNGGTITTEGIYLNGPLVTANAYARLQLTAGTIYLGTVGLVANTSGTDMTAEFTISGGTLAAKADWASSANLPLTGPLTVQAADALGAAHNITLSGVLSGAAALIKTGSGTLTLDAADTYTGDTTISNGTLALGASGSLNNSGQVIVGSGTTFDVSQAAGYTVPAAKALSGLGTVLGDASFAATSKLTPGINPTKGTLTFSNNMVLTGTECTFDLIANPASVSNDLVRVVGDLNISGGGNTVEIIGAGPAGSVHPLFKYGTLNGSLANLSLASGPAAIGYLTNITSVSPNMIAYVVTKTVHSPTNVIWLGNVANNVWDSLTTTNWLVNGSLDYFINGDLAVFNGTGQANSNVLINSPVTPVSTMVDSAGDYVFSGSAGIGGLGGITKTNAGKLTIQNDNGFTGGFNFNGGTVSVATLADIFTASPLGHSGTLAFNGGALEYTGASTAWTRGLVFTGAGAISIPGSTETLALDGQLTGTGGLTKVGNGTLVLNNPANSFAGGTLVSAGVLTINTNGAVGTNVITLNGGLLAIGGAKPGNTVDVQTPSIIRGGNGGGLTGISGLTGDSDVTFEITTGVFDLIGNMLSYSNTVTLSNAGGATFRFNGTAGSSLATFDLGEGPMDLFIRNSQLNPNFGALKGGVNTTLSGRGTGDNNGPTTLHIGANGLSTTFDGVIRDGSGGAASLTSIVKTGAGKLTLTGASTYTGTTTVSNGILQVDGSLAATTNNVIVDGGTLSGNGAIANTVTVNAGGNLAPGASIGTLTISGDLNLGGTLTVEVNTTNAQTADLVTGVITNTFGGTLAIVNLGPTPTVSDTFQLFSAGTYQGTFASINPPSAGPGLIWDTSTLATDGILRVAVGSVAPTATNITFTKISGSQVVLNWPAGQGWKLQTQTNALSVGLKTNWVEVVGATPPYTNTVSPATAATFFRLVYP
jgi:fibronectin-binding autotransporter adhesin